MTSVGTYGQGKQLEKITPASTLSPIEPRGAEEKDTTARLLASANLLNSNLSSYIPSISWTGSVSARGFKTTPLRTVLHYCLAAVFGLIHQTRVGHSTFKVDLYPNENKVEVVFTNSSVLLLEALNSSTNVLASVLEVAKDGMANLGRVLSAPQQVVPGVFKFIRDANDPKKALDDFLKVIGDQMRHLGVAGIWDMAQSDIYAGQPPLTMLAGKPQPYMTMFDDSFHDKKPMLTRKLAVNPQAPQVAQMHFPTHFDLRSLVAQALYDPGVLPPPPDTNVALPNARL